MQEEKKAIGYLLERTTRVVKLNFHKTFKELKIDLTPEQWVIIDILSKENHQPQKNLADHSYKNAPTISRIIDVLCKKGWVERTMSPTDRRIFIISLTKSGKAIHKRALPKVIEVRKKGWKGLTKKDSIEFNRIIDKVFANYIND